MIEVVVDVPEYLLDRPCKVPHPAYLHDSTWADAYITYVRTYLPATTVYIYQEGNYVHTGASGGHQLPR